MTRVGCLLYAAMFIGVGVASLPSSCCDASIWALIGDDEVKAATARASIILLFACIVHALCCLEDAFISNSYSLSPSFLSSFGVALAQALLLLVPFEISRVFQLRVGIFLASPLLVRTIVASITFISVIQAAFNDSKDSSNPTSANVVFVCRALLNFICIALSLLLWTEWSWRFPTLLIATIAHTCALAFAEHFGERRFESVTLLLLIALHVTIERAALVQPVRLS